MREKREGGTKCIDVTSRAINSLERNPRLRHKALYSRYLPLKVNDANATAVDGLSIGARAHCIRSFLGNLLN